jgi:hypothetical protein
MTHNSRTYSLFLARFSGFFLKENDEGAVPNHQCIQVKSFAGWLARPRQSGPMKQEGKA